ncbi:helix-turn-helix domain-containing protein [Pseudonocardia sp. RS11V-5]|uniref:helix-turn-helix domain-containing protein n=1 Tax=Pseudonocardia terrae TaxID=2905831 RepID=UPI001E600625|nr:helix-turn-helix domain-containing protein [Pseudonocardia terrae]MCE3553643.1 helix-turn-helix domain-containing protein [Pseudonocardia terrae]
MTAVDERLRVLGTRRRKGGGRQVVADNPGGPGDSKLDDDRPDDVDHPSVSMGRAAEILGVRPAFLRSLDNAGALQPHRTDGGHRRYSRRQLTLAGRLRELLDTGHTLASAQTIADLEDRLVVSDRARERADDARREADDARREADDARRRAEDARREADDARNQATEALDTARSDLRHRADELARAREQLDDARGEIEDLTHRLRAGPEGRRA